METIRNVLMASGYVHGNRQPDPPRQDTHTLYDEVIVSTSMIALPSTGCP